MQVSDRATQAVDRGRRHVWVSLRRLLERQPHLLSGAGRIPVKLSIQLRRRGFNGLTSGDPPAGWFCLRQKNVHIDAD
jgi:hypothetical protein